MGSDITSWDKQVENYRKYFSILVFDNLGSGKSDEPRSGHSMEIFASNTLEILDHLKIRKTHMIGKSMGGMIAQVFAGKYKNRVDKLVLGCTAATRDDIGKEIINIAKKTAKNVGLKELWFNALLLGYSREYVSNNFNSYKKTKVDNSENSINGYLKQCDAIEKLNNIKYIKKIISKTLIIHGKDDLIVDPKKSYELALHIKNSQLISFPGGHGFWKENVSLVDNEVVDFLIN